MIRFLLLAFPRAWRNRYGNELMQLVDDAGLSPRVVIDLIGAGVAERLRELRSSLLGGAQMVIGPAWRHPRGTAFIALLVLTPVLGFVLGSLLAYQLGFGLLLGPLESVNSWLASTRSVDLLLVLSPPVALLIALAPLVRLELPGPQPGGEAVVGLRLRLANFVVGGLALVVGGVLVWHVVFESVMELGA